MKNIPGFTAIYSIGSSPSYPRSETDQRWNRERRLGVVAALPRAGGTPGGSCHASSSDSTVYDGVYECDLNGNCSCCSKLPNHLCINCENPNNQCSDGPRWTRVWNPRALVPDFGAGLLAI
jgi:hypothetical protein